MRVDLETKKTITLVPAQTKDFVYLTVNRVVDVSDEKRVYVVIDELPNNVDLWTGNEYDSIGQWTDIDVVNRIKQIFA